MPMDVTGRATFAAKICTIIHGENLPCSRRFVIIIPVIIALTPSRFRLSQTNASVRASLPGPRHDSANPQLARPDSVA